MPCYLCQEVSSPALRTVASCICTMAWRTTCVTSAHNTAGVTWSHGNHGNCRCLCDLPRASCPELSPRCGVSTACCSSFTQDGAGSLIWYHWWDSGELCRPATSDMLQDCWMLSVILCDKHPGIHFPRSPKISKDLQRSPKISWQPENVRHSKIREIIAGPNIPTLSCHCQARGTLASSG